MRSANAFPLSPASSRYAESVFMPPMLHNMQRHVKPDVAHREFADVDAAAHYATMQLAAIRKQKGLSIRDLADLIGMDASTVQRAEVMDKTAKLTTYRLCAEALGVDLADLFSDDRTSQELALLRIFRAAEPTQRARMIQLLELAANLPAQEAK